jgi:hypothetical protein
MQRPSSIALAAAAVALGAAGIALAFGLRSREPAVNPDPNHTHADFRVVLDGTPVEFTDDVFQTGSSTEDHTRDPNLSPLRKFLHLHDGLGHVVHRHKPGLTLRDFFDSLSVGFTANCIVYEAPVDRDMACSENDWRMVVNGQERPFSLNYEFADGDKILLTTAADQAALEAEWEGMTDDACRYSRTCPWRGDPPAENCVADPEVPCIAPLD